MTKITLTTIGLLALLLPACPASASTYDVPAGTVARHVWTIDITGVPPRAERHQIVELLADEDRFRLERKDAESGETVEIVHGSAAGYVIRDTEDGLFFAHSEPRPLPGPGFEPERTRGYVAKGLLRRSGVERIAGRRATTYGFGSDVDDGEAAGTDVAVDPRTFMPLRRTSVGAAGVYGQFRQDERTVSWDLIRSESLADRLARAERWARERALIQARG